ncbi:ras-related protein Rab-22A isoform X2 [Oncorhynchus tshawytscha]|uniref:Uncharacterized protein n=1 Tax=Oncorhynchus tshawytscha TaxID=74940 RepID=A0AAZ3STC1_ONCTS|nr:ras-related protein Rab-22A isoform X2 [Oncorhynchus tshawytscha]
MHVWITEVPYVGTNVLQRLCGSHHCLRHHQRASVQRLRMKRSPKARRQIGADSFQALKNWMKELRQHGPPNIVVAIAGNKCDLSDAREVLEKDAMDYADSIHTIFVETSAKNTINIHQVFIEISQQITVLYAGGGAAGKGFKLHPRPAADAASEP